MKFKYDKESDILLIELSKEKPDFAEQKGNIITHYNRQNKPVEIEILNAKKTTTKMMEAIKTEKAIA